MDTQLEPPLSPSLTGTCTELATWLNWKQRHYHLPPNTIASHDPGVSAPFLSVPHIHVGCLDIFDKQADNSKQWSRFSTHILICMHSPPYNHAWQLSLIHLWPLDPNCHTILLLTLDLTRLLSDSSLSTNQTKVLADFLSLHNYPRRTEPRFTTQSLIIERKTCSKVLIMQEEFPRKKQVFPGEQESNSSDKLTPARCE